MQDESQIPNEVFKRKVGGNKFSFQITLPKEWAEFYNLKRNDWVELKLIKIYTPKDLKANKQ